MTRVKHSLRKKMSVVLVLALVVSIGAAAGIIYGYTWDYLRRQTLQENTNLLYQSHLNLQNYMDEVQRLTVTPYTSETVYAALGKKEMNYQDNLNVRIMLSSLLSAEEDIYQVHLYSHHAQQGFYYVKRQVMQAYNGSEAETPKAGAAYRVRPAHASGTYGFSVVPPPASRTVVTIERPLYSIPENDYLGVLHLDVQTTVFADICNRVLNDPAETVALFDQDGQLIYTSGEELFGEISAQALAGAGQEGTLRANEKGDHLLYSRFQVAGGEWTLAKWIPASVLHAKIDHLMGIIFVVILCVMVVAALGMVAISYRFTQPILELAGHIQHIQSGNLENPEAPIKTDRQDEIGVLYAKFQEMMDTINNLVFKEYKLNLANKTNQLRALQAQLDPHFLNNALQSIGTQALREGNGELYELITALAYMMNYAMSFKDDFITIGDEIQHVESYLKLQKQRFGEDLHYSLEVDGEGMPYIPKMIIQPLVENYFKHGFEKKPAGYLVAVTVAIGEERLSITVEDNGCGMDDARLRAIRARLVQIFAPGPVLGPGVEMGIGLSNVAIRLKLYYANAARMEVNNNGDGGLSVYLEIPLLFPQPPLGPSDAPGRPAM